MALSKSERKKMVAEAAQKKAQAYMNQCYLKTRVEENTNSFAAGSSEIGSPELGNCILEIEEGESMIIIDRWMLKNKVKLTPETAVILDEFGGDFGCDIYGNNEKIILPIGHRRQNIWPDSFAKDIIGEVGTDSGSIACIASGKIKNKKNLGNHFEWKCSPGKYYFCYEEVAVLGVWKQPFTRNIIITHFESTPITEESNYVEETIIEK